eukprot:ctg_5229.g631
MDRNDRLRPSRRASLRPAGVHQFGQLVSAVAVRGAVRGGQGGAVGVRAVAGGGSARPGHRRAGGATELHPHQFIPGSTQAGDSG